MTTKDLVERVWDKYLGKNTPEANLAKELATEIDRLRTELTSARQAATHHASQTCEATKALAESKARISALEDALGEIAWSNDTKWQRYLAYAALNG